MQYKHFMFIISSFEKLSSTPVLPRLEFSCSEFHCGNYLF